MNKTSIQPQIARPILGWPLLMAFIRLPLGLLGYAAVIWVYQSSGYQVGLTPALAYGPVIITIVNFVSLALLLWRGRVEGFRLRDRIGFRRETLLADLLLGVAWSFVLYIPLATGVFGVILLAGGIESLLSGEAFYGGANFMFDIPSWIAYVSAIAFPLLNAPIEELNYRGYAQPGLIAALGWAQPGLLIASAGFGLQHIVFAITSVSALAYTIGFFIWGLGAGLIAYRQQRLAQVIVAHFISNLIFGAIPLVFLLGANIHSTG